MEKIRLFWVLLFLTILSLKGHSQILINSNGQVGINQSVPGYNLDWYGTGRFWSGWGQLIFDSSGIENTVNLHPAEDWCGSLGTMDKKFNLIYTHTLYYNNLVDWSDERLKENIRPLESSLDKIRQLNGVAYNMKKEFYHISDPEILAKVMQKDSNDFGFLAQEAEKVIPEIVSIDPGSAMYSVNYVKLIPVLVEAIKEQQTQIEELQARIEELETIKK